MRALAQAAVVLLSLFWPSAGEAQVLIALLLGDKVSNERFQLGLNVNFAATGFWGVKNELKPGWSIALYGEIHLTDHFHLQPELIMKAPGGARELSPGAPGYDIEPIGDPAYDEVVTEGSLERELRYIALPVLAKGVFGPIGLALGPQIAVLHGASDTVSKAVAGTKVKVGSSVEDDLQRFDAGIAASAEYAFSARQGMRSLRIRARGYLGLMDTVKDNPRDPVRNWSFSVGLDIPIGGKGGDKAPPNKSES
jgi:hypothetical protein